MIQLQLKVQQKKNVATTEVTKQVTSENNQQLDVKEIDTEDLILQIRIWNHLL